MSRPSPRLALNRRTLIGGVAGSALLPSCAVMAGELSQRPVTLVVSFPAGSGTDSVARIVQPAFSAHLNTPVVIENRPGANAMLAASSVARATPDGHTVLLCSSTSHAIAPNLSRKPTYDSIADFVHLARVGFFPFLLVCNPALGPKSTKELIALARAKPGELKYAHGNGTGLVAGAAFKAYAKIDVLAVPYRGTPAAILDIIAGRIHFMIVDATTALPHVASGAIRALGVTSAARSKLLPDLEPIAEAGLAKFNVTAWCGVDAPKGLTPAVQGELMSALRATLAEPSIEKKLADIGFELSTVSGQAFGDFIEADLRTWKSLLEDTGISDL